MIDQVEVCLQGARKLVGTGIPPELALRGRGMVLHHPDTWSGGAATSAQAAGTALDQHRQQLRDAHNYIAETVRRANLLTQSVHRELTAIEHAWKQDRSALAHLSDTPDGRAAMLRAAQVRIAEVREVIENAAQRFRLTAEQADPAIKLLNSGGGEEHWPWEHIEVIMEHWTRTTVWDMPAGDWPEEF